MKVIEEDSKPSEYLRFICQVCKKNTIGVYKSDLDFLKKEPNYKDEWICSQCSRT